MLTKELLQKAFDKLNEPQEIIALPDNYIIEAWDAFGFRGDPAGELSEPKVFKRKFPIHKYTDDGTQYILEFSDGMFLFVPYETIISIEPIPQLTKE